MELSAINSGAAGIADPLFDWAPDAERLEREVRSAELKGLRDELTLAEIECSMDLLDAEIAALRERPQADLSVDPQLKERTDVRRRLAALAVRLERLPG
jgi:hypothetical protein